MARSNALMTEATRTELLSRARAAFAEFGYADAPLEALVRAAGMTKGALYHHFGSKQGLFVAVVRGVATEIAERVGGQFGSEINLAGFLRACADYLDATTDPGVRRILLIDAPAVLSFEQAQALEHELGVALLREGLQALKDAHEIGATDIEALAHLVNGALNAIALWAAHSDAPATVIERGIATLAAMLS